MNFHESLQAMPGLLNRITKTEKGIPVRDLRLREDGRRIEGEVRRADGTGLWQPTTWLLSGKHQLANGPHLDTSPLQ